MQLQILGCYSATPSASNHPTAQLLEIKNHLFLIDCGEATQFQLRRYKIKFIRIKHIFISHLHGDHFFGLVGLISTFSLLNRKQELHVYGPKGIKEIILLQLKLAKAYTSFQLYFHELESNSAELIYEDDKVSVETIPLEHRVYTNGFLFKEKEGDRKLLIEEVKKHNIDVAYYRSIKKGKDATTEDGTLIPNEKLTEPPAKPKSYAFCSDTVYKPEITNQLKNVNTVYHESTFLEQHLNLCDKTKHSTAKQAAQIAKDANAKRLILGHYSTRYGSLKPFKEEAKTVFENVVLAEDGKLIKLT